MNTEKNNTPPVLAGEGEMTAKEWADVTVALSIRQPWAWLICRGLKDIENRSWATGFRGRVLVHAGLKFGKEEKDAVAMVRRVFGITLPERFDLGGIVGGVEIVDCVRESKSRWFAGVAGGGFGFVLENAVALPFRAVPGKLGFFNVVDGRSFLGGADDRVKEVTR